MSLSESPEKQVAAAAADIKEALPLGWTRVVRSSRNKGAAAAQAQGDEESEWCGCNSNDCRRRLHSTTTSEATANTDTAVPQQEDSMIVKGTAVFCLPEPDCEWFQGYLFVSSSSSSSSTASTGSAIPSQYGLLARQQEIDECLQCADGGYREITLQATPFGTRISNNPSIQHSSAAKDSSLLMIDNIQWTGGDMMRLRSSTRSSKVPGHNTTTVVMDAAQVWTGRDAQARVEGIFGSLLRRLRTRSDQEDEDDDQAASSSSVQDLMPNVAVVSGPMELRIPMNAAADTDNGDDNNNKKKKRALDD